jgi:hypothetical protein
MFGKSFSEYAAFQKPVLILLTVVFLLRLGLSLAGAPISSARFVSVTSIVLLGSLYYGWAASARGFGSFKQLYGANLVQGLYSQVLVALAIVLGTVTGQDNIYTIPEFYPPSAGNNPLSLPADGKNLGHAAAHVVVAGAIVMPILGWLISSIVHLVARRSRPAAV